MESAFAISICHPFLILFESFLSSTLDRGAAFPPPCLSQFASFCSVSPAARMLHVGTLHILCWNDLQDDSSDIDNNWKSLHTV